MTEHAERFLTLLSKKQKLLQEESKLITQRKKVIGDYAAQFNLLSASDALITGLFYDAQSAIKNDVSKIKAWESQGARFQKSKKQRIKTIETDNPETQST